MPTPVSLRSRLKNAWNALIEYTDNPKSELHGSSSVTYGGGYSTYLRTDRKRMSLGNEKSIVASIYTRLAIDVAAVDVKHVKQDQNEVFKEVMNSPLNECLTVSANIDQSGRELIFDIAMSMFDEGVVAVVPVVADYDILENDTYKIYELRVAQITQWYPRHVRVRIYNDITGEKVEMVFPKEKVAIIENPFYSVMNQSNSTLKRLVRKLNILDAVDEQSNSSKLDLIIQLPYVVKSEARLEQADKRRKQIEEQLNGSKYGIAYIDGAEKVTQLNRSAENNLMAQVEWLTSTLYSQLGLSKAIFDGTANSEQKLDYFTGTIEPILSAIADELKRKFITRTARAQGQTIMFFRDPFKLTPIDQVAQTADTFMRNEVLTPNEVRCLIGYKPSDSEGADELRNRNINQTNPAPQQQMAQPAAAAAPQQQVINDIFTDIPVAGGPSGVQTEINDISSVPLV